MIITETEKLYSPLEFYLHDRREEERTGEYGTTDLYDERYKISVYDAAEHMDAIELAIRRDRDRMDKTRGMAEYLDGSLGNKVISLFPEVENYGTMMVCAAKLTLSEPLTPREMTELKNWWRGQLSDGWGEGFEQREIKVGREELYVVPWSSDEDFFLETEREFFTRLDIDERDALKNGRHKLVSDTPDEPVMPGEDALKQQLFERLDKNMAEYRANMLGASKEELFDLSGDIASRYAAREYMKTGYDYKTGEVEYLLRFQDPLSLVAESWPILHELGGMDDIIGDILEDRDSHGHYAKVMDAANPAANEKARSGTEKESVLERIRAAEKAPKEPRKDKATRERPELEL